MVKASCSAIWTGRLPTEWKPKWFFYHPFARIKKFTIAVYLRHWRLTSFCHIPRGRLHQFFKKPWWVGPLLAGLAIAIGHPRGTAETTGSISTSGYLRINNSGTLPRYGSVVVTAVCPTGKHLIGGGYVLPGTLATASSSRLESSNTWRVNFRSFGSHGQAKAYAVCESKQLPNVGANSEHITTSVNDGG